MRRIPATMIVLAVLLALAVSPLGAAAKKGDHPIVGTWIVQSTAEDPTDAPELVTFNAGGTLVSVGPEGATLGSWAPSGQEAADLTFKGAVVLPDVGFLGFFTIRGAATISEDGQSFTGTYTVEPPAAFAEGTGSPVGELGPAHVTGERVTVEQMGHPVGPIPDFAEQVPGPDESPAVPPQEPMPGAEESPVPSPG